MQAILLILACVAAAIGGLVVVRRFVRQEVLSAHTAVAGIVYAALSVVYGVLLGQVVIAAWDDYTQAEEAVDTEAGALINLYRLADAWDPPDQTVIQDALIVYAREVIQSEWPVMARGDDDLQPGDYPPLLAIWSAVQQLNPATARESAHLQAALEQLTRLEAARSQRLVLNERQLPRLLWVALIGGAVVTVGFSYLLAVDNQLAQGMMLSALTALVALLLYLVHTLEFPFQGPSGIKPEPFAVMLILTESDPPPLDPAAAGTPVPT